ncbi:MAG: porin family protein, partial [Mesorhizobium sp.]
MRRLTLASAGLLALLSGSAQAADLDADLPMTAPGFDWTGYYAGLQGGYGWGNSDMSSTGGAPFSASPDLNGGFIGGHVAGLWQFDQAVLGAQADLNYSSVNGAADLGLGDSAGAEIKWFGSVDAKAGYAMDRVLVYGIGGIAFAGIEASRNGVADTRTDVG